MGQGSAKLADLKAEIRLTKENLRALTKAKKTCDCEGKEQPHYHVLVHYDAESSDEYLETSESRHLRYLDRLKRNLVRLEGRLAKLGAQTPSVRASG